MTNQNSKDLTYTQKVDAGIKLTDTEVLSESILQIERHGRAFTPEVVTKAILSLLASEGYGKQKYDVITGLHEFIPI